MRSVGTGSLSPQHDSCRNRIRKASSEKLSSSRNPYLVTRRSCSPSGLRSSGLIGFVGINGHLAGHDPVSLLETPPSYLPLALRHFSTGGRALSASGGNAQSAGTPGQASRANPVQATGISASHGEHSRLTRFSVPLHLNPQYEKPRGCRGLSSRRVHRTYRSRRTLNAIRSNPDSPDT